MLKPVYIRTFGRMVLEGSDFVRPKPLLVLVYLALVGPVPRRRLADLFWPDAIDARDSLATTLRRLRKLGPDVIQSDEHSVWTGLKCDAPDLLAAARAGQLNKVKELHQGAFLDGLSVPVQEEVEEWLYSTRERLTEVLRSTGIERAMQLLADGDVDNARAEAEALIDMAQLSGWQSGSLLQLELILHRTASRRLAELTSMRIEAIDALAGTEGGLPGMANVFIGRAAELEVLRSRLESSQVRFITLHGPGGVGKTRLAIEAARLLRGVAAFSDGVFFVPLETVTDRPGMAAAIATAVGLPLPIELDIESHLLRNLATHKVLLVLDNAEQLTDAADMLSGLIRNCPGLHLLVTSRQTFQSGEEFVIQLEGLPAETDALELLQERVLGRGVSLSDAALKGAAPELCKIVEGSPLAIELAAAQMTYRTLDELVKELQAGLDVLSTSDPTTPERHRSLRAALEVSWAVLSDADAAALARCSVFSGGFDSTAALSTGIHAKSLEHLLKATYLRRDPGGRFSMHPQVQQDAAMRLNRMPKVEAEARADHCRYYLDALADPDLDCLGGPEAVRFDAWVDREFSNVLTAWEQGIQLRMWPELATASFPLGYYTERRGNYREVHQLLRRTCQALRPLASSQSDHFHLAGLTGTQTYISFRVGRLNEALELHQETALLVQRCGPHYKALWGARQGAGLALLSLQRLPEALAVTDTNASGETSGSLRPQDRRLREVTVGMALVTRALIRYLIGDLPAALRDNRRGFSMLEAHLSPHLCYAYWVLGICLQQAGDPEQAQHFLEDGIRFAKRAGFRNHVGYIHLELARIHTLAQRLPQAQAEVRTALTYATESADRWLEIESLAAAGEVADASGEKALARRHFLASMKLTGERGSYGQGMAAVLGLAKMLASSGRPLDSARLLAFAARSQLAPAFTAMAAESMLAQLSAELGDQAGFDRAVLQGASLQPQQVFQAIPMLVPCEMDPAD